MSPILANNDTGNYSRSIRDDLNFHRSTFDDGSPPLSFVLRPLTQEHDLGGTRAPAIVEAQPRNPLFSNWRDGYIPPAAGEQPTLSAAADDEKGWSFVSRKYDENPYLRRLLNAPVSQALEEKKHKERMKAVDRLLDGMGSPYVFEDVTREKMAREEANRGASPPRSGGTNARSFAAPSIPDDDLDGDSVDGEIRPYIPRQPKHRRRV
jgi:hypothetical protein